MKKTMAVLLAMGLVMAGLTGCSGNKAAETTAAATEAARKGRRSYQCGIS